MASFEQALPFVLRHEGGWSDDPDDPGGATNFGITLAVARQHGITTKEELRAITPEQVAAIYRAGYWCFDGLDSQAVAAKLFDLGVNWGRGKAVRVAQEALNALGASLTADGWWGPKTEATVNAMEPNRMLDLLCAAATRRYQAIAACRPKMQKFLKGWLKRAEDRP